MATKKEALAIIKDRRTGLRFLAPELFETRGEIRTRYPREYYKIIQYPVIFGADGYVDVEQTEET